MKKFIYVPSYCLAECGSRLTEMSLQTTKEGISIATKTLSEGKIKPILILSTSRPVLWKKEAEIKKVMILEAGLSLDDVIIIPNMMDSFEEAEKIKKIISDGSDVVNLVVVAEKWHAPRVFTSLKMMLPISLFIELVKVNSKIERHLDTTRLRSWLCSSTKFNYILWQLFFGLIGPLMMRRQMKRMKKKNKHSDSKVNLN